MIGDGDGHTAIGPPRLDAEPLDVARELDRVVHQVRQRLSDGVGVHRDFGEVGPDLHFDLEALLRQRVAERLQRLAHERLDSGRRHLVTAPPALDAGKIEHVVDEP